MYPIHMALKPARNTITTTPTQQQEQESQYQQQQTYKHKTILQQNNNNTNTDNTRNDTKTIFYKIIINTSTVSPTSSGVDTHRCKLRNTPAALFHQCIVLWM